MKIYYHTGLLELVRACRHEEETLNSLQKCRNFKQTHYFLVQAWQSIYRSMIMTFMTNQPHSFQEITEVLQSTATTPNTVLNIIKNSLTTSKQIENFNIFVEN